MRAARPRRESWVSNNGRGLWSARLRSRLAVLLAPLVLWLTATHAAAQSTDPSFRKFLDGLWPEAQAMGISRPVFDGALRGVEPDLGLPDLVLPGKTDVKGQAEFTRTP